MKKVLQTIKSFFVFTGITHLISSAFILTVFLAMDEMNSDAIVQFELLTRIFLFSVLSGAALSFLKPIPKFPKMLRIALEFLLCLGALYLTLFHLTDRGTQWSQFFGVATVFFVIYAAASALGALLNRDFGNKKETDYENVYSDTTK